MGHWEMATIIKVGLSHVGWRLGARVVWKSRQSWRRAPDLNLRHASRCVRLVADC